MNELYDTLGRTYTAVREEDPRIAAAVRAALGDAPEVTCWAGHDAGILAEKIPAGKLLVRNEGGGRHAPEEEIDPGGALAAAEGPLRPVGAPA